ncbi:MAG TPA: Tn7 transposase TnsA N-terminal domain-containing protein [Candidatus Gemmiger excrementipullorum]|uniref:Tn7 transposase TnsA N-terminal domain-containing protein n=1 Tax=Candidatus Gemmiger excrementipullorum TaxID=2838610 RepID=A0A9D1XZH1_9FIRM|nr:Tn7 transposase TnsA N-terminal domain-containing protein [Candidatus Gemmiger excrementipullorum]
MALTEKDLARLGPAARAQIDAARARQAAAQKARRLQTDAAKAGPLLPEADSELERRYYAAVLWPKIMAGLVVSVELHKRFTLYPADTYCGLRLPAAHYTPDFFITYQNGTVEAVEVKSAAVRKLQRDYIYRRRLFIERYARPNGWRFTEYIQE